VTCATHRFTPRCLCLGGVRAGTPDTGVATALSLPLALEIDFARLSVRLVQSNGIVCTGSLADAETLQSGPLKRRFKLTAAGKDSSASPLSSRHPHGDDRGSRRQTNECRHTCQSPRRDPRSSTHHRRTPVAESATGVSRINFPAYGLPPRLRTSAVGDSQGPGRCQAGLVVSHLGKFSGSAQPCRRPDRRAAGRPGKSRCAD